MTPGHGKLLDMVKDSRVTRTRADIARTALDVLTREGSDALIPRACRRDCRVFQDNPLHTLAVEVRPVRDRTRRPGRDAAPGTHRRSAHRSGRGAEDVPPGGARPPTGSSAVRDGPMGDRRGDEAAQGRDHTNAQRPIRTMLSEAFQGAELEAAISMLAGVVACPSLMFDTLPDDDVIEVAVDFILKNAVHR